MNENLTGNLQISVYKQLKATFPEEQNSVSDEDAENALIYGIKCYLIKYNSKFYDAEICLSCTDENEIDIYNKNKTKIIHIHIDKIVNISFQHLDKMDQSFNLDPNYNYICEILEDRHAYKFFFKEKKTVFLLIKGLLVTSQKSEGNFDSGINISLDKFNSNFNDELEDDELAYLASHIGLKPADLKAQLDKNNDNTITMEEFKDYVKGRVSGVEFLPIFNKYATLVLNEKELAMGPVNLQDFFREYQQEEISFIEACQLIIQFNSNGDDRIKLECIKDFDGLLLSNKPLEAKDIEEILNKYNKDESDSEKIRLYLTLYEFNMMLQSPFLTVYDQKKLLQPLDEEHPLTDYYISSTHNTYITGHQLIGKSSAKMYSTSMLYNYRTVELDCYDGPNDKIIITHGFTLVDDLDLEEILIELRKTAFVNSELPVILSIENHLDDEHQAIMVNKIKNILKDLYVFPRNVKPDYLPTLSNMKRKFLIKCAGRKLWKDDVIPRKPIDNQVNNLNNHKLLNDIITEPGPQLTNKKILLLETKPTLNLKQIDNNSQIVKKVNNIKVNNKKIEIKKTIKGFENILGIVAVKYNKEEIRTNFYKPWEMMTIKCSKAVKFSENQQDRKDILNLTQHCLLRIYPESFDSSNYNIIKCFSCGMQSCCLNFQATQDDYTLYNKIFFKQNEGYGYVLKPKKFLTPNLCSDYFKPEYICRIEIFSLINLTNLVENENLDVNDLEDITLSIYAIGVDQDENNNLIGKYKIINGTMFPSFKGGNPAMELKVYEYELSAVFIKIKAGDKILGRSCIPYTFMKQGLRRIPIYNNKCFEMKKVYMVGHFILRKL